MRYPRCMKRPYGWNNTEQKEILKRTKPNSPLEIDLILKKVLSFLERQDLSSCRLVSTLWTQVGSEQLRNSGFFVPVNIVHPYNRTGIQGIQTLVDLRTASLKCDLLKDYFPYNKFELHKSEIDFGNRYTSNFFDLFNGMTHLKISEEALPFSSLSTLRELLLFRIDNVVHLEIAWKIFYSTQIHLELFTGNMWEMANPLLPNIRILSLRFPPCQAFSQKFVLNLLRSVPHLGTLKLHGIPEKILDFFLNSVMGVDQYPLRRLVNLHLTWDANHPGKINQNALDRMVEIGKQYLKLKTFTLSSITNNIQLLSQQNFFKVFSPTLEKVVIEKFSTFRAWDTVKSTRNNLKYFQCHEMAELCSLDFVLKKLTVLETLVLGKVGSESVGLWKDLAPSDIPDWKPHPLKHLVLPPALLDNLTLPNILARFGTLCRLELTADDNSLKVIYQSVPQLQEIILFSDSNITDEGITGFTHDLCKFLYENQCELPNSAEAGKSNSILRQGDTPWIGYLKKLRLFQIVETEEDMPPKSKISNVSIVFGFKFLKELSNLKIPKTWISDSSLKYIGAFNNLVYLDVSYCFHLTPKGLEDLKEQYPNLQIKVKNWYPNLVSKYRRNKNICIPYHFQLCY